ncbi:hypothetical protein Q5P01_010375 [Channa striata]|uniref:G-protein coupled receptors family 3 profile domain-containing protein n=1 Tax=Channa striata TaxID=64152 RepID=A0AA88SVI3_CHASR|nr:hypothetical protein Q5P01_010375 [Channa striata]
MNSALVWNDSGDGLKPRAGFTESQVGDSTSVKCKVQDTPPVPAFSKDGDYIIGGVFSLHSYMQTTKRNYTFMPEPLRCTGRIDSSELQASCAMIFAIEEINKSTKLLPGIRLGYQIHDSCASVSMTVKVAFQLINGLDPVFYSGDNCSQSGMVMAVVGESGSTPSISMSRIIGSFNIPEVSHSATCACLSDKQQYPSFFRTIPSDQFQAEALAKLVKQFGWTWIGAVRSDSDYGNNGMASFLKAAHKEGICVEYSESFYRTHPQNRIKRVADVIRRSTAKVVLAFVSLGDLRILLEELSREPSPPRQWIGSEAWVTHPDMLKFTFCAGAIGFAIPHSVIPGLRDFLLDLSPTTVAASPVLTEFWEDAFNCSLEKSEKSVPTLITIPSDQFQAEALAKLVKQFGWSWIGAVRSDSDYGNNGMASFLRAAQKEGICVEYSECFNRYHPRSRIQRVADVIRRSTAVVIVAFVSFGDMKTLMEELSHKPFPPHQWIGSEAWVTHPDMLKFTFCAGAIGFGIPKSVIPGLRDFLLDLPPTKVVSSPILTEFWEDAFNCRLEGSDTTDKRLCDGSEDIEKLQSPYTDTSQLRITNMVYKAVYALAHAIHNAVSQETNSITQCDKLSRIESKQILGQLKKVNFSQNGYHVSFDANGDPVAKYELVNWQKTNSGSLQFVTVGYYDASLPVGQEFLINKNVTWMEGRTQVPVSVCSDSCPPGTHKVLQKGKPICCYDCILCPEGEISNETDSTDCFPCPKEFWPNTERDTCFPKTVEFLSFSEVLGIILAVFSVGGTCLAIVTTGVFFRHRTSPIVRANNSELSFLLLFSLTLCFLCSLTFIGAPSEWSCMLRHTAFGITFVLCISCVLGKTIVVLMAFKATLPGSNIMKWFGLPQQRMTVVTFTFIQVLICTVWLVLSPPFPMKNLTTYKDRIILECALGSAVGFWAVLGYIGLLAVFCFVLAVLARKLPDNFNEAKFITFSMLIFCAVWITFIPAYVSSPGKFTVAVEIFAILASSFGLILCIFAPKCFIILFKPEKNTKKHLMNKNQY